MAQSDVISKDGSVPSPEDLPIRYTLYEPGKPKQKKLPVVLFIHGFKGFKDWGPFPEACKEIASKGHVVIACNLSRNGVGESLTEFDELDLFEDQTLSQDLTDVDTVIKAIQDDNVKAQSVKMDKEKIGIIGHSRGGHTAAAATAEYNAITCLITWSAVANYNERWSEEMISDWNEKGYTEIENARTGQTMRINKSVYEDARENADKLMADKRITEVTVPTLIIHGANDESVPRSDADKLFQNAGTDQKNCIIIPDTGHTFDGAQPFEDEELPKPFQRMLSYTCQWLDAHL